jgi:hypothetical protein
VVLTIAAEEFVAISKKAELDEDLVDDGREGKEEWEKLDQMAE